MVYARAPWYLFRSGYGYKVMSLFSFPFIACVEIVHPNAETAVNDHQSINHSVNQCAA